MIGRHIGPFEVLAKIGEGGMGEVYRARDTKLKREVALKVLPAEFSHDPDRIARFQREAELLATLNHPNIAAIYGLEDYRSTGSGQDSSTGSEQAGVKALVLELIEGPTLAERIAGAGRTLSGSPVPGLPLDQALAIARQIADALEVAHEKGIIHRDLKPSNVKVKNDGTVKVLDFGLARALVPEFSTVAADTSSSPTLTTPGTAIGMILGTAAYMAPEQARGAAIDRRADIWAFGAVVYEMLSGRRAFDGTDVADTLAAVLRQEIDWAALPTDTPASVRHLLVRCLERDVKRRLRDIGEARIALDDLIAGDRGAGAQVRNSSTVTPAAGRARTTLLRAMPAAFAAIVAGGLTGAAVWFWRVSPPALRAVTRFALTLPDGQAFTGAARHLIAMSPDGSKLVYVANNRLHVRSMSEQAAKPIQGTEGYEEVNEPVFSPDGRSVAFHAFSDDTLKRIDVGGGVAVTLASADVPTGMSWGADGIVFGQGAKGVMRLVPNTRTPEILVRVKDDEWADGPEMLPGGQHVLFTLATGNAPDRWDKANVVVQSIATGERKTIVEGGSDARYMPSGHLVYAFSGSLFVMAFDVRRLETSGEPVRVVEGVRRATGRVSIVRSMRTGSGAANFSVSNNGSLAYVPGPAIAAGALLDIALMDRRGAVEPLKLPFAPYAMPRVSPDGSRVVFWTDDGKESTVSIYDLSRTSTIRRLTFGANNRFPIWNADGRRVAFQSDREGDLAIFWQAADGSGTAERLTKPAPGESHTPDSWSPDGQTLLFSVQKGSDFSLATLSLADRKATPFGDVHSSSPPGAVFAPDGHWVAYASTERGRTTTYVEPFPATGAKHQFAGRGADSPKHPRWSPDGKELFLNISVTSFASVSVTTQPAFAFGNPVPLPKTLQGGPAGTRTPYDVTPDGRFVGLVTAGDSQFGRGSDNQIEVILNWTEELRSRVARDRVYGVTASGACASHQTRALSSVQGSWQRMLASRDSSASADDGRFSGSFSRHCINTSSKSLGIGSSDTSDGNAGGVCAWWRSICAAVFASKSSLPVSAQ
jgi:serine/threonine-protein kinase